MTSLEASIYKYKHWEHPTINNKTPKTGRVSWKRTKQVQIIFKEEMKHLSEILPLFTRFKKSPICLLSVNEISKMSSKQTAYLLLAITCKYGYKIIRLFTVEYRHNHSVLCCCPCGFYITSKWRNLCIMVLPV